MSKILPFTGSGVAIVTPFDGNKTNYDALGELIEMQIANDTDAIIICGTTGEASTMPDQEHLSAIEYAVNKTAHAVELSKKAAELGADGILTVTPYYNKTTQKGLVSHFGTIANSVDIPVILYNVPSRTGMNISVSALKELSKIENIVAIKEASGNISYTAEVAANVPDIYIYSGNDDIIVPIMSLGGKGVISVLANVAPKQTHDMCSLYLSGEVEKSAALQLELLDLINALFVEVNPVPVKTALRLMGYNVGNLRAPLCDMEEKNLETLKKAMQKHGLIK